MWKDTPSTAVRSPKRLTSPATSRTAFVLGRSTVRMPALPLVTSAPDVGRVVRDIVAQDGERTGGLSVYAAADASVGRVAHADDGGAGVAEGEHRGGRGGRPARHRWGQGRQVAGDGPRQGGLGRRHGGAGQDRGHVYQRRLHPDEVARGVGAGAALRPAGGRPGRGGGAPAGGGPGPAAGAQGG